MTTEDMKREKRGTYRGHEYFAVEKDGITAVFFQPALPRDDQAVLGAIREVFSGVLRVDANVASVRPVGRYLRFFTPVGAYDVLLMKEDNGTVNGFSIQKTS